MTATSSRLSPVVTIYLLCIVLPLTVNLGSLSLTALRILLVVITVPLFLRLIIGKSARLNLIDILFILHIGWMAVALWVNNPAQFVEQVGSVGIEFMGGYLIGRTYIRGSSDFVALCQRLSVIVLISFPFAIYETLTSDSLILKLINNLPIIASVPIHDQDPRLGLERVQFTFAHPIHYGLFCAVAFSMAFVGLQGQSRAAWRFLSSALIVFCGFLALSSGALLAIALQFGLIFWAILLNSIRQKWWILLGLSLVAYIVVDVLSNRTPVQVFLSYATFSTHTAYWRLIIFEWGMINIWDNPIFGIGLNDWVRPWFMYSGSMDNFWLVMAVRYGIPGFAFITLGYLIGLFKIIFLKLPDGSLLAHLRRAWVFTFCGLTFTLCTVHVWANIYSFVFFMFGAGIWLLTAKNDGSENIDIKPEKGIDREHMPFTRFNRNDFPPENTLS